RNGNDGDVLRTFSSVRCVEVSEALAGRRKHSHDKINALLIHDELKILFVAQINCESVRLTWTDCSLERSAGLEHRLIALRRSWGRQRNQEQQFCEHEWKMRTHRRSPTLFRKAGTLPSQRS